MSLNFQSNSTQSAPELVSSTGLVAPNGGLENIRLKFTGYLAQFSNLEIDTEFETEFISKMNTNDAFDNNNEDTYNDSPF